MPHQPFTPSLRAQWLGQQLRQLREQRGMTLKLVATHLGRDLSALGRYERADWPIGRADVVALLDLYGLHDAERRARLLQVAEQIWHRHHWDGDRRDPADVSFINVDELAGRADRVSVYHPTVIPTLDHLANTTVEVIIGQAALHHHADNSTAAPARLLRRPRLELRVLASGVRLRPGLDGPFTVYHLPDPYPPVGHLQTIAGHLYVEAPASIRFVDAYKRLRAAALDPGESARLINALVENPPRRPR